MFPTGGDSLPPDVINNDATATSYPQVFETWDSEPDESADDAAAMAMSRDAVDLVDNRTFTVHELAESNSWDSDAEDGSDTVAMTTGKDSVDVVVHTSAGDTDDVADTWDSEEDEDMLNRNSCEILIVTLTGGYTA